MIQKIEAGYLQLLRIVLLLLATGAIVIAIVLSGRYASDHDAQPKPVNDDILLSLATYSPSKSASTENANGTAAPHAPLAEKDQLFEDFDVTLHRFVRISNPSFTADSEKIRSAFDTLGQDPTLGRPFLKQFIRVLSAATKDKNVVARIVVNAGNEYESIAQHFIAEYRQKQALVDAEKKAAADGAQLARANAAWSLYAAGAGFLIFAGLVLLIVLLKIERNLRSGIKVEG